jgi:hypothetical protein
MTSGIKS